MCTACHQADGSGKNVPGGESWPRLAGLDAAYIAKQLHDYQSGERSNASMMPFANMLDEQQIADVAAYYASLPATQGAGEVFPGIAGQHAGYIKAQLQAWKAGTRNNDTQDLMGSIARRMSDDDIQAVAAWLAGQKPVAN